jgi:IrrE N-terminal-like domain
METLRIGGRRYSDPDVISLCRQTGELIDPRSTVVHMARSLVSKVNGFHGVPLEPFERLKVIASLCGIKIQAMDVSGQRKETRDAVLYSTPLGRTVLFNPLRPRPRVVFTIGHEIIHTFFPNSTNGARFRSITNPDYREANELERLCDLGAAELVMPVDDFRREAKGHFALADVERLASRFGTSLEATAFRLATANPGLAVAGLLRFRRTIQEQRKVAMLSGQTDLFPPEEAHGPEIPEKKYRRQSIHMSASCNDDNLIRWNKSFDHESVVYRAVNGHLHSAVESLPNVAAQSGRLEAMLAPYQREEADENFGDVLFLWQECGITRVA